MLGRLSPIKQRSPKKQRLPHVHVSPKKKQDIPVLSDENPTSSHLGAHSPMVFRDTRNGKTYRPALGTVNEFDNRIAIRDFETRLKKEEGRDDVASVKSDALFETVEAMLGRSESFERIRSVELNLEQITLQKAALEAILTQSEILFLEREARHRRRMALGKALHVVQRQELCLERALRGY